MTSTATFVAQTLPLVSLPFYFQKILQFSPVKTGLLMTPWPVGVAAAAPLAGWFADRMPVSTLAGSGLLVMTAGLIAMLCLPGDSSAVMIGLRLGICGVGFGFFQAPNNRALMSSAPIDRPLEESLVVSIFRMP